MVEDELCNLKEIDKSYFIDYINKLSVKQNALVREEKEGIYWYYCTNCKKWHKDVKCNIKTIKKCPHCNHRYEIISKRNVIPKCENYITVLETNKRNELIIRLFYFYKHYDKHEMKFNIDCFEVERINFDRDVYMKMNTFPNMGYVSHHRGGQIRRDKGSSIYYGKYRKYGELYPYTNVVTKRIKKLLKHTQFKYSCLDIVAKNHLDIHDYLIMYRKCNKLELLVKNRNFKLIEDIISKRYVPDELEYNKNFKYLKYDLDLFEFINASYFDLMDYNNIKIYGSLNAAENFILVEKYNKNINKICHYLVDQKEQFHYYGDYLSFAYKLGYDLEDKKILYPNDLHNAHDELYKKVKYKQNEEISKKINERSKKLDKFNFNKNQLSIFPVHSQTELINESRELKHCVRSYATRVARGETNIFLIRKDGQLEKPYVTLELNDNKVIQCRGYKNNTTKPLDEKVKLFVNDWCKKFGFISCFR